MSILFAEQSQDCHKEKISIHVELVYYAKSVYYEKFDNFVKGKPEDICGINDKVDKY